DILGRKRLDRSLSPNGHIARGLDLTVVQFQFARPRRAIWIFGGDREFMHVNYSSSFSISSRPIKRKPASKGSSLNEKKWDYRPNGSDPHSLRAKDLERLDRSTAPASFFHLPKQPNLGKPTRLK